MANGEQGNTETLALMMKPYKIINWYPHKIAKQSIKDAGSSLLRNTEVYNTPANEYIQNNVTNHDQLWVW